MNNNRILGNSRATAVESFSKALICKATSILSGEKSDGDAVVLPKASIADTLEVTESHIK